MSKPRGSPRKFSEKIALLNKKEAEATAEFEKILKEVEETTRAPPQPPPPSFHHYDQQQLHQQPQKQYWGLPTRSSSFSNWQTSSHAHESHVNHQQNHSQFLTEPVQFNGNHQLHHHNNHHHQQPQPQQQPHQQQRQHQGQHIDCATRLRPPVYIDNQQEQTHNGSNYQSSAQQQQGQQQQQQNFQRHINHIDVIQGHVQARPIGVPNIEIFPIDDDRSYSTQQQQQVTPLGANTADCLTNGHFHPDSSNSSISSARSLPNISNLSVSASPSSTAACTDHTKSHFLAQTVASNQQQPLVPASDNRLVTEQSTSMMSTGENSPDNYAHSSTNDYFSGNDDYCSLPAINEPMSTDSNHLDESGQSRTDLSRTSSWQQVMTSSAPSSAAPTPPAIYQQQSVHSPTSSSHSQQHSPQNLHQNYYPIPGQTQGQLVRASSTNFINNNDLLEAPSINNNLSKSSDAYYGYLDNYGANDTYFDGGLATGGGGNNLGNNGLIITTSPLMRSSNNNDGNIPTQNNCKQTNQCTTTTQQQSSDTPQYQFYG